jgi:hypothetical protein
MKRVARLYRALSHLRRPGLNPLKRRPEMQAVSIPVVVRNSGVKTLSGDAFFRVRPGLVFSGKLRGGLRFL